MNDGETKLSRCWWDVLLRRDPIQMYQYHISPGSRTLSKYPRMQQTLFWYGTPNPHSSWNSSHEIDHLHVWAFRFSLGGVSSNYVPSWFIDLSAVWLHGLKRIWQSRGLKEGKITKSTEKSLTMYKSSCIKFYQFFHCFHCTCLGTLLQMPLLTSEGLLLMILRRSQGRPSHPYVPSIHFGQVSLSESTPQKKGQP